MDALPRYCYCWSGQARWPLCPDDRVCGQCGRRLLDVAAEVPVLAPGPPPLLVAYVHSSRASVGANGPVAYAGTRLTFCLAGGADCMPEVRWDLHEGAALSLVPSVRPAPTTLQVQLQAELTALPPPGPFARGRLSVGLGGEVFPFDVATFFLGAAVPSVWLSFVPGVPSRPVLNIHRGAASFDTYLHLALPGGVPFQWEAVECRHPAVTLTPPTGRCGPGPAWTRVVWNPAALECDAEQEEVEFILSVRGRPRYVHPQRRPLAAGAPAGRPPGRPTGVVAGRRPPPVAPAPGYQPRSSACHCQRHRVCPSRGSPSAPPTSPSPCAWRRARARWCGWSCVPTFSMDAGRRRTRRRSCSSWTVVGRSLSRSMSRRCGSWRRWRDRC